MFQPPSHNIIRPHRLAALMSLAGKALSARDATPTSFTPWQNRSVLIAGLTCACISVLATLITLRWFLLMNRNFRHKLIMFLIFSDTFKAFWYFIFPVVVFSRGPVSTSSGFCQASGFFLAVGIEASDFAILMIAFHSILYIFHPPARSGDIGGLYRWRKWIYSAWIGFPVLAASLAFVNHTDAYATSGTFCYLPRRPFWYRLALSWIPRYFIMFLIFGMYISIYIYVTFKFRSFSNLQESESRYSSVSHSRRSSMSGDDVAPDEPIREPHPKRSKGIRPAFSRSGSYNRDIERAMQESSPWDEMSFITSKPLRKTGGWQSGVQSSDFALGLRQNDLADGMRTLQPHDAQVRFDGSCAQSRNNSHAPTTNSQNSQLTGSTAASGSPEANSGQISHAVQKLASSPVNVKPKDPLKRTRKAIRKQLRYLFIYPGVYLLMWIFPFASHCLLYDDHYVRHPIYWLTVVSTCMVSLQAGVDCVVFSWREKPWRRIPENTKFSLRGFRHSLGTNRIGSITVAPDEAGAAGNPSASGASSHNTSNHWWEAEGRKRKDSVWLGTDTNNAAVDNSEGHDTQGSTSIPIIAETIEEEHGAAIENGHIAEPTPSRVARPSIQQ